MRYNRYGDDFLIDKIKPDDLCRELTSVGELAADGEWQIINDNALSTGRLIDAGAGDGFRTERDREEGKYELEDIRMDARCQERKRGRTEHTAS